MKNVKYFSQIPRTDGIVESSRPEFSAITTDVNTRSAVSMALKLTNKSLVVKIPNRDISITTTTEANFVVRTDGQCITCRR